MMLEECSPYHFRIRTGHSARYLQLAAVTCLVSVCLASLGCSREGTSRVEDVDSLKTGGALTSSPPTDLTKIKFKVGEGEPAFSWKPEADGAKLLDASENEISRYSRDGAKLKIKGTDDVVLAFVVGAAGEYKIKSADQQTELWKLQKQADGDWKLKDGNDSLVYMVKKRPYGFEIEDASEKSLAKIKLKDGKLSLRDPAEKTLYYTKDQAPAIAMSCLGFDAVKSLPVRFGLLTVLLLDKAK